MTQYLQTERLDIRPFSANDREALAELLLNDAIKQTYMLPDFADDAALTRMINVYMNASASDKHFTRGIFLENRLIGFVNDTEIQDKSIEFGYVIHPSYWGHGYATEMFRTVIGECFKNGFSLVKAAAFRENPASFRVMEKCGMRKTSQIEAVEYRGKTHDCICYEIHKQEEPSMQTATSDLLLSYDNLFEARKQVILTAPDTATATGTAYYVSGDGSDENNGLTPQTPWKTLSKVSSAPLNRGDAVFFRRGDIFRGKIHTKPGVTYAAYGNGDKPKLYGSEFSLADPALWEPYDPAHNIWKCTKKVLDAGTLVFNGGEAHSLKLIPSYIRGKFVCREDESKEFDVRNEMKNDLDMYWHFDDVMTTTPSKGEDFPVPNINDAYGDLYLRCDRGNPGYVFDEIESLARTHMFCVGGNDHVTIDNVCVKYVGMHGVGAGGHSVSLHVTNCEFGWIGGCLQHYFGTDPNYPEGGRGTVTRFGNAIEVYGGCTDYVAANNYIYEVYDAGITHQVTTSGKVTMTGVRYTGNVIEKCVYGIEYFLEVLEGGRESIMEDIVMADNFIRLSGYGWGQQRHNKHTPALIKGWSYVNTARNYVIRGNIFDRCAYRMLHLVAEKDEYCPAMEGNTYIQHVGGKIGQYGGNEAAEPENLTFDEAAEEKIREVFGDTSATVYGILCA